MTLDDINNKASQYTNATTTYSDAQRLIDLNLANNEIQVEIWKSSDEWDFDDSNNRNLPIYMTDIVAGQQDYGIESDMRRIKRLEITYDGTNWVKVTPFSINETSGATDDTHLATNFNKENPYYDTLGNSILLYPIPDASVYDALKIWVDRDMSVFETNTGSDILGFDPQFHRAVPMIMAREWFMGKEPSKVALYESMIDKVKADIRNTYSEKQQDRKYNFTPNIEDYS